MKDPGTSPLAKGSTSIDLEAGVGVVDADVVEVEEAVVLVVCWL